MHQNSIDYEPLEDATTLRHRRDKITPKKMFEPYNKTSLVVGDEEYARNENLLLTDDADVEEIVLSDDENLLSSGATTSTLLNVDSNCRITSRLDSSGNFSKADSCVTQFCEGTVDFVKGVSKMKSGSNTDSEDLDLSDEENVTPNFLSIKYIDLNSLITVSAKPPSDNRRKFESKTSEESSTDVEVLQDNDYDTASVEIPLNYCGSKEENHKAEIPVATTGNSSQQILPAVGTSSSDFADEEMDDEVFLLQDDSENPPDCKLGFLRKRQGFSYTSFNRVHQKSNLQFHTGDSSDLKSETSENTTDSEVLSDEEIHCSEINKVKSGQQKVGNSHYEEDYNSLTDEEELFVEGNNAYPKQGRYSKKWTETDESGSIRQVTQIKTETSIKLSGEEDDKAEGEDVSHTTTTTTRIVTTVTTQDENEQQHASEEGGDELRHSMEVILNQFMSEDAPSQSQKTE